MDKNHPSREECFELLKKHGTPEHVVRHCKAVAATAVAICEELNKNGSSLDIELIQSAGLIHDIARVEDKHWEVGSRIARELGYEEEADIIMKHMFHSFSLNVKNISELDLVCLGDRLVKEDEYVGIDVRMKYIMEKARRNGNLEAEEIIKTKTVDAKKLIVQIETLIGISLDELMKMKGLA